MTDTIPPIPEVPPGLREAAQLTKLIPFVRAGASKLAGCPDWNEFPYWKALDYLTACAKVAGEHDDAALAGKILNIIRSVSAERDPASDRANFYTFRRFAEILGLLPTASITTNDLELIEGWLNTKFDHDMVANALDDGALPRFLNSPNPADWAKAVQLFKYCTAIRWQPDRLDSDSREPVTVVEEHWLKDLVNHHATALGRKAGASVIAYGGPRA